MSEKVRAHVLIGGRVQGVCFRMYAEEEAVRHQLAGWVRNLPTGQVEAVFEGSKATVDRMIAWCRKGPPAAQVRKISVEWETPKGDGPGFRIVM